MDCRALRARNDGKSSRGGVLVEFAIGAPILITIMLYGHDIFKMARIHERMEFVAHEMINIFQNISQSRADKKITANDIRYAVAAAYLSIFPGQTMYTTSKQHAPLGYVPSGQIYCVKGLDNGNVSVM